MNVVDQKIISENLALKGFIEAVWLLFQNGEVKRARVPHKLTSSGMKLVKRFSSILC